MKCPKCKEEVSLAAPAPWIGFTDFRQPVIEIKCSHGHAIRIQLATMASYKAPRATEFPPKRGEYFHNGETTQFCCPLCLCTFGMKAHKIAANGVITPSVVCPKKCGFHTDVTFMDWKKNAAGHA